MSTDQQDDGRAGDVQGPTVPRMLVGIQLHRFREAAGITPDQAAYEIRASRSKISRMENGLVRFKERDVTDLLTLYGITDEKTRSGLVMLTRQANTPGWWSKYGDIMADWFEAYLGLETAASVIRTFELQFVHGLFQTEDYARAILSARPDGNLDDLDEQVAARLARQAVLDRTGAPQLWCVLDEGVLHRAIGGSKVMRSQLYHLAEVAEHPKTTIQVIRTGGAHAGLLAHFVSDIRTGDKKGDTA